MSNYCTQKTETILITGVGQRIGLYLAETFLEQGYQVIGTYRTKRVSIQRLENRGVVLIQADFSTEAGVAAFTTMLKEKTDSLRAIIHNASAWSKDQSIMDEPSHFSELFHVHMFAPFWINHHCRELLAKGEGLRDIISLTDFTVRKGSDKHAAYLATKSGLESLTLSFAKLFAPRIKVNAIAPALIMFNEGDSEEYKRDRLKRSALQIEPGPNVVWQAVNYLMQSTYSTGVILPLDGGRHIV